MRRVLAAVTSVFLAGSAMAVTSPPAVAKSTYKACVKKSTGEMRLLLGKKKKCKKGWKKLTWTKAGPTGKAGLPGVNGQNGQRATLGTVVDATGTQVGEAMGTWSLGFTMIVVRIDGGDFYYLDSGILMPNISIYFSDATCSGAAFVRTNQADQVAGMVSSPTARVVYRKTTPNLGPSSAYRFAGTSQAVTNAVHYSLGSDGTCTLLAAFTGFTVALTPVVAPPDRPGPLRIV
ncbi:MAG: hypothetical protein R2720_04070 [Candidatus Nanopelagicales bacterium]